MSFGKSKGTSQSSSGWNTQDAQNYGTDIWGTQAGYLGDLYARAQQQSWQPSGGFGALDQAGGAYGQAGGLYGQSLGSLGQAGSLYGGSLGYLGQAGGAYGQSQAALNRLANPTQADPMQAVYARNLGQQFNEQIMPGLKGDAAIGGGLGGSRAGIAQGLAGARMGQQMQDFAAQLYGQQQDRALQAGQALQGVGQGYLQGMQGMQQAGAGYADIAAGQQAAAGGMGNLGQAYQGLATQQQQMPWYAIQQYAGLLGPAVMRNMGGYARGSGTTSGSSSGGGGFNIGLGSLF
jgi:hypothetical protein